MLSIAPLASPDYYLGSSASSGEPFTYFEADKGKGVGLPGEVLLAGNAASPDPLLRHGRWLGRYGAKLGLATDSPIRAADFEALYYGLHPRSGQPLRSDGKSRLVQMADAKERAACKQALEQALRGYNPARAEVQALESELEQQCKRGRAFSSTSVDALPLQQLELQLASARSRLAVAAESVRAAEHALRSARQKSLRPGTDLVFSAPKSVSMQWAALAATGDAAAASVIEQAHDRAVRETFERMQSEFVMTRKRDPESKRRIFETVQGVIASQWRHFDARPSERQGSGAGEHSGESALKGVPDPQLHDHINLFAPVEGADGLIYAAYTDYIRQNIKALGAQYRSRLAVNLVQAGYAIERDPQKNGVFFSLCGVSREQAKLLSSRTADIEALVAQGKSDKDAKLHSRRAKNGMSGKEVLEAWKQTFASMGLDPRLVKAATLADSVQREVERKVGSTKSAAGTSDAARSRLSARLMSQLTAERTGRSRTDTQILDELLARDAYFSLSDIRQLLWEDAQFAACDSPAGTPVDLDAVVEARLRALLRTPDLLRVFDPDDAKVERIAGGHLTGLNRFGEPVFTTYSLREREAVLFRQTVPALLSSSGYGVDREIALRIIRETEEQLSAQVMGAGGASGSGSSKAFALRDFQLRAVLQAACGDGQLAIQIAGAGLGKTTASQFTKGILASQGRRILGVAPSNKAASGLGRELGIEACSLDRLLIALDAGRLVLDRKCVVFVDEAGMASFDGMEKLFSWAKRSGAKLILTGDPEQLPAVARGNVLRKLTQMEALVSNPDALLYLGKDLKDWDRVSRQKEDWAKQASTFFSRGYVDEGLREYERRGCVHAALTLDHLGEEVAQAYLKDPALPSQKLILATTNDQVRSLNQRVRTELKKSGELTGSWVLSGLSGMELSLGDRVVFKARLKADQAGLNTDVAKNEFGTVLSVQRLADGSLDIQCQLDNPASVGKGSDRQAALGNPQIARFNSGSLEDLDHAFATTVHRSQGMTVDSVIAVPGSFLSKELFYVMATRHRQNLQIHLLESDKACIQANAGKAMVKRHAQDLALAESLPEDARARLDSSNAKLVELHQQEQGRFERLILAPLRAWDMKLKEAVKESSLIGMDRRPVVQLAAKAVVKALEAAQWATVALRAVVAGSELSEREIPQPALGALDAAGTLPGSSSTPMSATVIMGMKAVLALKGLGPPSIREALKLVEDVGDAAKPSDSVAFGRMVDLLPTAVGTGGEANPGTVELQRVARGVVVHQDDLHLYLALPGQTRVLVVDKVDLGRWMPTNSSGLESPSTATLQGLTWREVEVRFDGLTAKPTAMTVGARVAGVELDDREPVELCKKLAAACRACGMQDKASMLDQGKLAVVDLSGHRGKVLEGVVLGMTTDQVFVLSGLEVVRIRRSDPALEQLDEAGVWSLVGKSIKMTVRNGRAETLKGLGCVRGLVKRRVLEGERADDLASLRELQR